jgi:haloalkane dehalogenase
MKIDMETYTANKSFPHYTDVEPCDLSRQAQYRLENPSSDFNYEYKFVELLDGVNTAYIDEGEGKPVVFVHGATEQAYIYRNIMPFVESYGRIVAMDNLGHGLTDKSDTDDILFDSYRLFEAFCDRLELSDMTLVAQDWGSVIALYYASQNPGRVRGLCLSEALCAPAYPILDLEQAKQNPGKAAAMDHYNRFRSEAGEALVFNENGMLERVWDLHLHRKLSQREKDTYRFPFSEPSHRKPLLEWPRAVGLGGDRPEVDRAMQVMNEWMLTTDIPILDLYGFPGCVTTELDVKWRAERLRNHEAAFIGVANHFTQEDAPEFFGRALAEWYRRNLADDKTKWYSGARSPMDAVGAFGGAVVGGDLDTALEIIHADCTWIYAGPDRIPFAGSYHGPDGVAAYLQKFGEEMEILSFEPTLTVDGDLVILRAKELNRHKISGRELNLDVTQVYEVRNGQIIFFQEFVDTAAILALYS